MRTIDEGVARRFSAEVKAVSWGNHQQAEQMPYLDALVGGRLDLNGYAAMVVQHYFIYSVLEDAAAAMRDDGLAGDFIHDGLTRLPALEADLHALLGADWRARVAESAATARYTARLRDVCFDWPGGFVAHHYTRYLGDLSGGQFIAAAVRRVYGLAGTAGTEFYVFDRIGGLAAFKARYRDLLDAAIWPTGQRQRVVDEVLLAYRLNTDVLAELGQDLAGTDG